MNQIKVKMIIINFKNYKFGKKSLRLARKIEKYLPRAVVAVPSIDIGLIAGKTKLKVYAQHVDCAQTGNRSTGLLTAKAIKVHGAIGTLLNHSEHPLSFGELQAILGDLEEEKLKSVVCVPTLKFVREVIKLKPSAIAFEDVELIATNKSITNYKTDEIREFAKMLEGTKIIPLCGAGISSVEDVREALRLGCRGVLIASAIANVNKPERLLKEISKVRR